MLVRDGRLTPTQVDTALALQRRVGGRLGTVLVEMGVVDLDTLTVYLGLDLGIPIATRAALERAKKAAVRVLTPELAERFLCVPLVVQDRQLIAAMRDPHDLLALDELAGATGYQIIPRVAPEARLYYYVERYYRIPRPARFRALGEALSARGGDGMEPPPPPLPGLPPQLRHPVIPPLQPLIIDEDIIIDEDTESDEPLPRLPTLPPIPPRSEIATLDEALARMAEATSRGEIADAIIAYAKGTFDLAVLLVVRDELAMGWRGMGPGLDGDRVATLLVPLASASVFRSALDSGGLLVGPVPANALHQHISKVLRTKLPDRSAVLPILIRDRVVNLFYAQGTSVDEDALRRLGEGAGAAYVRLIALHKKTG
jgi:Type II secretion system (T2SS), protein E, N-terminal domain